MAEQAGFTAKGDIVRCEDGHALPVYRAVPKRDSRANIIVVQEIFRGIRAINAGGTSVLLVEQNARYALETAQRGYVLQTGSVIASGACADLKHDERVKEAYLGRR